MCFEVCSALDTTGTAAVLTGGSAATYYAPERYQSRDADFVITLSADFQAARQALADLGYVETGGIYRHPKNPYTLDFPRGPLAIGDTLLRTYTTVRRRDQVLYVISRSDCVCDRLAWFYHYSDRTSLATALSVAESGAIDLEQIRSWSEREGAAAKFQEFLSALRRRTPNA